MKETLQIIRSSSDSINRFLESKEQTQTYRNVDFHFVRHVQPQQPFLNVDIEQGAEVAIDPFTYRLASELADTGKPVDVVVTHSQGIRRTEQTADAVEMRLAEHLYYSGIDSISVIRDHDGQKFLRPLNTIGKTAKKYGLHDPQIVPHFWINAPEDDLRSRNIKRPSQLVKKLAMGMYVINEQIKALGPGPDIHYVAVGHESINSAFVKMYFPQEVRREGFAIDYGEPIRFHIDNTTGETLFFYKYQPYYVQLFGQQLDSFY